MVSSHSCIPVANRRSAPVQNYCIHIVTTLSVNRDSNRTADEDFRMLQIASHAGLWRSQQITFDADAPPSAQRLFVMPEHI